MAAHLRLPASLDDLRGLRAARWIRESTRGQYDTFGPDAQREQQDRAIERYGLVDAGLGWTVSHSGRTIGSTSQFAEMLASAGRDFDVLVVGYVSRFARDLRTAVNARHELHSLGAVLLFCDERVLSSDEEAWEQWARETVEAEAYSRRLGKRIREGYAAKFRRLADQGGRPPLGFHRVEPAHTLAVDPDSIGRAVALFERYAGGVESIATIAESEGLNDRTLTDILANPIYNGWVERREEGRRPAPWRSDPPVSDDLWERVSALRERRTRGGGKAPREPRRVDMLRGLLVCTCGRRIKTDGTMGTPPRVRKLHPDHHRCPDWGEQASYSAVTWEPWIAAQVAGVKLAAGTLTAIASVLAAPDVPIADTSAKRLERARREIALDHAAGRLTDEQYLIRVATLRAQAEEVEAPRPTPATAERAIELCRALPELWRKATPAERAELVASIYATIVVRGREFVKISLTPHALAHGLALALPERVTIPAREWAMARPTGDDRPIDHYRRMPVEGAREWREAARRSA